MSSSSNSPSSEPVTSSGGGSGVNPYIPSDQTLPELTIPAVLLGSILGIIFGASSLYLMLKVGMTVSASIPVAVLSITLFKAFSKWFKIRRATILENNIVQTAGSAGESIAFGVGATMPALLILGFELDPFRVMMVSCLGGLLGILMMIPLRKAFIVNQHDKLPYPEGTACAKVLVVGEQGGTNASKVFFGFGLAFLYQAVMKVFGLWKEDPTAALPAGAGYTKAVVSCNVDPALLGVGYIIGPKIASTVVAGGILASFLLIPAIAFFGSAGSNLTQTEDKSKELAEDKSKELVAKTSGVVLAPGTKPIAEMTDREIFGSYVKYIGAGAVAMGGFISMFRALPLIIASAISGVRDLRGVGGGSQKRTEKDLPIWVVGVGSLILVGLISSSDLIPTTLGGRIVGAILIVILGFLFVTVSSRMTGEIGSSSNPISGMTIATLLITCLVFWVLGWVGPEYRVTALCIAGVVCIASSNGGTTSQDLKTGYLVGATPSAQQIAILVGSLTSAVCIGFTLLLLNSTSTIITGKAENLPPASVKAPVASLEKTMTHEGNTYKVWTIVEHPNPQVQPGVYLVDQSSGEAKYLVDPAFSTRVTERDSGQKVQKFSPPQPGLFATIINGVMTQKLPWGLVIFGGVIALVVHLTGGSALAFAVGLYLPLSTTLPIFIGGMIRAGIDRFKRMTPEEADMSPGVLAATGYIAGASIAGILIAVLAAANLPMGTPPESNIPAIIAFVAMALVLILVGTGFLLPDKTKKPMHDTDIGS